jgi:hypothetical protein
MVARKAFIWRGMFVLKVVCFRFPVEFDEERADKCDAGIDTGSDRPSRWPRGSVEVGFVVK